MNDVSEKMIQTPNMKARSMTIDGNIPGRYNGGTGKPLVKNRIAARVVASKLTVSGGEAQRRTGIATADKNGETEWDGGLERGQIGRRHKSETEWDGETRARSN